MQISIKGDVMFAQINRNRKKDKRLEPWELREAIIKNDSAVMKAVFEKNSIDYMVKLCKRLHIHPRRMSDFYRQYPIYQNPKMDEFFSILSER